MQIEDESVDKARKGDEISTLTHLNRMQAKIETQIYLIKQDG